ncbi:MAG: serine/threonine protein kinase [Myxococcales bacterium]|nr:serine/threonine protein kinase [Myxococcales bacterium]
MALFGSQEKSLDGALLAGRYRIEARLGSGGMGEVYRAVNEALGRPVAIKVLHPEMLRNDEIVERFMREARAATLVRHPNVVDVLDVLEHEGVPFIVQELLSGKDLSKYLEVCGGKLTVDEALPILIPIVEAVGVAHQKGVVHRDLKPENVFLHEVEGQVIPKVLDFGISKLTAPDAKKMTGTGLAMGTPAYMSPEQIQGSSAVDASSDVWSLGVVLFECLSGRLPFDAETPGALFVKICTTEARRLDQLEPSVSPVVVEIVWRCLRPKREDRYANATELARALRGALAERGVESTNKLQAISPAIIDALESKGALAPTSPEAKAARAADRTQAATPSGKNSDPDDRADRSAQRTELETPSSKQNNAAKAAVVRDASTVEPPARRGIAAPLAAVAVLLAAGVGLAAVASSRTPVSTQNTPDAGVVAVVGSQDASAATTGAQHALTAVEDAAHTAAIEHDAALTATSEAVDAGVVAEPTTVAARRTGRNGSRASAGNNTNGASSNTAQNDPRNAARNTQPQGASGTTAATGTTGSTITTTSGRRTHAATTYEN